MKEFTNNCAGILYVENGITKLRNKNGKVKTVKKIFDTYSKERVKEALKNVKKRMKSAAKFKGVWSDEFIMIEHLQSALSKKQKINQNNSGNPK